MNLLQNILSADDQHPLPFDQIKETDYPAAFEASIAEAKERLMKLKTAPSTFAAVIEGIESYKESLDRLSSVFFSLSSANTSDFIQALAKEVSPKIAELSNDLILDQDIFTRVQSVYAQKEEFKGEERELLEKTFRAFKRNGAALKEAQKEKLREIDRKLAGLTHEFSDHVLKATNEYIKFVDDFSSISELPAAALENAKELAKEKGKPEAWAFTLHFPSLFPLLQKCTSEEIRKEIWHASSSKGMKAPHDNKPLLIEIAQLRHARANLLGYSTHANFVLEERMAESPDKVRSFLKDLAKQARSAAERDLDDLRDAKKKHTGGAEIFPWDFAFYSERVKQEKYGLKDEEIRPYFPMEKVIQGVFEVASRLYQIQFEELPKAPVYHPDVKVYSVRDAQKKFLGYFYTDFFPRASKRGGAWMTNFLEQGTWNGKLLRPHVSIVCNFTKPSSTQPSLLNLDEVRTTFHEFGHALHSLLTDCKYASLSGTNVYWDFVELPSQIMENWCRESEAMDLFAQHYQTGAPMPTELKEKIKKSARFQAGWQCMRQLSFGFLDFAWHGRDPGHPSDIEAFEQAALEDVRLLPAIPGTSISSAFSHIFAGGYSAGYYSYKWAEVLDADAFEFFKEKGIFSAEVAKSFRENILQRGGTEHPMALYKKFRGREPDTKALLRRDGLL